MQFSESWLRSMVDARASTEELAQLLTMGGFEVEHVLAVAPPSSGIVVGAVLGVEAHPQADKLTLCRVDVGRGAAVEVVCGAPNVRAGMRAPCALPGARLPGGMEIKVAKVRGVASNGMLCSARELGLSQDHSGLLELAPDAPVGADFGSYYELDDRTLEVKLTPNRPDCLSVLGIAREVASLSGAALRAPEVKPVAARSEARFPVRISDPAGCGRFAGRVIRGVDARARTPDWMRRRLERAGQRPISALVDVTNYVMLELGRPLHVYDLARLKGAIDVRFGRAGESLLLLNGQTVSVSGDVLCITDESGPIGLAGIMGGESTKADEATRDVFLESAFFFPEAIAGRARRFNFTSDAAHRFERGVDFDNNVAGIERATRLILEICGGEPGPTVDTVARLPARPAVAMRVQRAQKVIGVAIPGAEMEALLARLDLKPRRQAAAGSPGREGGEGERITITPPSYRFDLAIEEDVIEEVARLYGFDRIPALPPRAPAAMQAVPEQRRSMHALRDRLADCGYQEVVNYSFVDEQWERDLGDPDRLVRLLNPIASHLAVMRTTLLGGLIANIRHNVSHGAGRVRVFEIGRVFRRDPEVADGPAEVGGVRQPLRIAGAAYGPLDEELWGNQKRNVDFFDVRGDLESVTAPVVPRLVPAAHPALHPGRGAVVELSGEAIGWVGELHPRWVQKYELGSAPVVFELDAAPLQRLPFPHYDEVSKYPSMVRDLAVHLPDSVSAQAVLDLIQAHRPAFVTQVSLFDLYRGSGIPEGRKSLAFRVVMQDTGRTLTDAEADSARDNIVALLRENFGGEPR
jgi:phenylalanyl-tRNA synthetase beta chain